MTSAELLVDGFGRIRERVTDALSGLTPDQLAYRIARTPIPSAGWCGTYAHGIVLRACTS